MLSNCSWIKTLDFDVGFVYLSPKYESQNPFTVPYLPVFLEPVLGLSLELVVVLLVSLVESVGNLVVYFDLQNS